MLWCAERQHKVDELQSTFAVIKSKAEQRQSDLEQTLTVAEKFWDNLNGALATLKELQDTMASTDTPALEPNAIREQQDVLEVVTPAHVLSLSQLIDQTSLLLVANCDRQRFSAIVVVVVGVRVWVRVRVLVVILSNTKTFLFLNLNRS